MERLRLATIPTGRLPPPRTFTPLLDVPVDSYISGSPLQRSLSPAHSNWLLSESPHSTERHGRSPQRQSNGSPRTESYEEASYRGETTPERGRSPYRNGHGRAVNGKEVKYTVMSANRRNRTPLTQVFGSDIRQDSVVREQVNGHTGLSATDQGSLSIQEYELTTVSISKTKQSLGEFI